jgi:predicted nucleic acid-binding Zn ribbon protein
LHKLISMSTFHLKGSGWYVTDYAGKNQSTSAAQNAETTKTESSEKKSESTTTE